MDDPTKPTIESILADLDASEAEIAAGQTVPLEEVLAELQQALDQWRRDHSGEPKRRLGM